MGWVDPALEASIRERLDAGDVDGCATVAIRGYGPAILGYLTAVLRDEARADEAFAMFAEDFWKGLPGFRGSSSFGTWGYKIAWSAAARIARDPYRRRRVAIPDSSVLALAAADVRTRTAAHLRSEVKTAVQKLREALTPEEQTILVLRVDRDLSWEEVAEVMDVDTATLRKRFERVKKRLRDLAREHGIGEG
jgi:RNA polymerase sigma-70 factor (ECF subfamily)